MFNIDYHLGSSISIVHINKKKETYVKDMFECTFKCPIYRRVRVSDIKWVQSNHIMMHLTKSRWTEVTYGKSFIREFLL